MRKSRRKPKIKKQFLRANRYIRARELKVIDENGAQLGVLTTLEALRIAQERGFDLVEVSPKENPPVAKIMNYGQFQYQKEKEVRKQKVKQKKVEVKGLRLSLRIGKHDWEFRMAQAEKFLNSGNKVKLEMILRGRERQHLDLAQKKMMEFITTLNEKMPLVEEQSLSKQGGRLSLIVAPKNYA